MSAPRKTTKSAFSSFLQSANSASTATVTASEPDPTVQLLAALSDVPMTLSGLAEQVGLAPKMLFDSLGQLQDLRLVRRIEDDREGEVRFELLPGGRALLAKTVRG